METPFLGPAYVAQGTNLADQQLINLYLEAVDTGTGKTKAAFYMTPGLDLLVACGGGPIRPGGLFQFGNTLYVVSGDSVYSVTTSYVATLIGTINTSTGPVSFIANTYQVMLVDGMNAWILPQGYPLTGGTVTDGGTEYAVGDVITLEDVGGSSIGTAQITVATLSGSAVDTFTVSASGSFPTEPTSFTQASTTGSGSGFTLGSPTYGAEAIYEVPLPFSLPTMAAFQDGFGLIIEGDTQEWWQSAVGDLSIWPGLNFSSADGQGGNLEAIASLNDQVWLVKDTHTEIWGDVGSVPFSFQRVAGALIEHGIVAPFSLAKVGDSLACLSLDTAGQGVVVISNGYSWVRISTHALEYAISQYSVISDAVGFAYQQNGHLFYFLTFPTGNATWVYDVTASAQLRMPVWHQRAAFGNGAFGQHWAIAFSVFSGALVVGDYRNGNLYAFDLTNATDNGAQRKWLRSWRALSKPTQNPVRFPPLVIDMQTGVDVPSGTDPQVVLRFSDDGGNNWSNEMFESAGATGETAWRVKFTRLGSTRRNSGLDRILELSSTDQFAVSLLGAEFLT